MSADRGRNTMKKEVHGPRDAGGTAQVVLQVREPDCEGKVRVLHAHTPQDCPSRIDVDKKEHLPNHSYIAVRCSAVRCGVVQCGVVWCGVV